MRCLPPDHQERRGDRVLMLWGDIPYWTVVDRTAARFIGELASGHSVNAALSTAANREPDFALERDAAIVVSQLRRAGVVGSRRLKPPKERIESISVNVTNRCNLRCAFCYNIDRADEGAELSAEEMIEALDSVRRETVKGAALAILGGEPMLEKEKTLALAEWAVRRELRPIVSTNGLLVDEDFARRAAGIGLECQVSIDGASAESHEAARGEGTFERALDAVRTFRAAGCHTIMSMVFHAGNVAEIPEYLRLAQSVGADEARFIPIKQVAGGGDYAAADLAGVIRLVTDTIAVEQELATLLGRDYVSILAQTCQACALRQSCGTGSQTFLLDADGTVYPCISLPYPEFAAGNVRETPLREIWRNSPVLAALRPRVRTDARESTCAKCEVRYWCMGGCRGETYDATGRLDAPSVTCKQARSSIVEMLWTLSDHPELLHGEE